MFIVSLSKAALWHTEPAFDETSRDTCRDQENDKKSPVFLNPVSNLRQRESHISYKDHSVNYVNGNSGFESRQRRDFSLLQNVQTGMGPIQPTVQWVPGFFPESKATGAWLIYLFTYLVS